MGLVERIFGGVLGTRRVMPGELRAPDDGSTFCEHDASTLAGASGSPLIDPRTGLALAVHSRGVWAKGNKAVPLWRMRGDRFFPWR